MIVELKLVVAANHELVLVQMVELLHVFGELFHLVHVAHAREVAGMNENVAGWQRCYYFLQFRMCILRQTKRIRLLGFWVFRICIGKQKLVTEMHTNRTLSGLTGVSNGNVVSGVLFIELLTTSQARWGSSVCSLTCMRSLAALVRVALADIRSNCLMNIRMKPFLKMQKLKRRWLAFARLCICALK